MKTENKAKSPEEEKITKEIKISKNFFVALIIILVIGVFVFIVMQKQNSQKDTAAVVNGEIITLTELNKAYDSLPPQYAGTVTKTSLLNQIIQTKVFYQKAEKQGLVISNEEANQQLQLAKLSSGLSEEEFFARLAEGTTESELVDQYTKQLTIQKFIDENLLNKIQISDEEVESYYSNNPEEFKMYDQVAVRHILIGNPELSSEEQDKKTKELLPQLTQSNFCEFVDKFSTDTASIPMCGEYKFTQSDAFVEEFKKLSFEQAAGEMGIVRTQFGSHIIWTVEKIPARTLTLDEVSEQIRSFLKTEKGRKQYESFYEEVSKDSKIEIRFKENS